MRIIPSFTIAALFAFAPSYARAQPETASAATEEQPAIAAQPAPAVDPVQAEIQGLKNEIKELRAQQAEREMSAAVGQEREQTESERQIRVYGFADFGASRAIEREDSLMRQTFPRPLSFYLGRLNLNFDAKPDPDFRFLVETRLSLYPSGSVSGTSSTGQIQTTSTAVTDTSSANPWAQSSWGSIILARAVVDWTRYQLFAVRVGLFLTPFGIYNVDHGSPTIISTYLPTYLTLNWIPARQMGIQVFGNYPVDNWEVGYAATLANGQTADNVRDVGDSKALGGRLFVRRSGELRLLLGASALYRPYRRDSAGYGMTGDGSIGYLVTRTVENKQITVGVDQSFDYAGLRIRNELAFYQTEYTPGKRDSFMGLGGLTPDSRQFNWSFLAAYRYWKLEPYASIEHFRSSPSFGWSRVWHTGVGLNVHLRPSIILKTSWIRVRFWQDGDPQDLASRMTVNYFNGMLVLAF